MGNIHISSSKKNKKKKPDYVFGTLALHGYTDVTKALHSSHNNTNVGPRRILIGAKFLNSFANFPSAHHKRTLTRVLKRGCLELAVVGNNPKAPRRIFLEEVHFVLQQMPAPQVEVLELINIDLHSLPSSSSSSNGAQWKSSLAKLTSLETLTVESSRMTEALLLDLLSVVERLPALKHLTLNLHDLSTDAIQAMEQTAMRLLQRRLVSLTLPHYPTCRAFWAAVAKTTSLKSLSVNCQDQTDLTFIQTLLLENNKVLKSLQLNSLPCDEGCDIPRLAQGLKRNTTLQSLKLVVSNSKTTTQSSSSNHGNDDKITRPGLFATTDSATTSDEPVHATQSIPDVLTPILEHENFTLQEFALYRDCDGDAHHNPRVYSDDLPIRIATPELEFYTQLNKSGTKGRCHLMRGMSTCEDWRQALMEAARPTKPSSNFQEDTHTKDLSTLYYWLRVQPTQWCQ